MITWGCTVFAVNVLLTALSGAAGRMLFPVSIESLAVLATCTGLLIVVLAVGGLILNLFAAIAPAGLLFCGYEQISPKSDEAIHAIPESDHAGRLLTC